jgi:hypothetical protein
MNKFFPALILIALGIGIIVLGHRRESSLAGKSEEIAQEAANAFDGDVRQPKHVWYYVGGGVLVLAGLGVAVRK